MNPDKYSSGDDAAPTPAPVTNYNLKTTELITRVRHEINNPLAALLGQAQLLLRDELSRTARRRVETIEGLAIRIKEIVSEPRTVQTPVSGESLETQ